MAINMDDVERAAALLNQIAHHVKSTIMVLDKPSFDRAVTAQSALAFKKVTQSRFSPWDEISWIKAAAARPMGYAIEEGIEINV